MEQVKLKDVKRGDYFTYKVNSPVWIKGEYCRISRKYSVYSFDDVNRESLKKGETLVYIGFTF